MPPTPMTRAPARQALAQPAHHLEAPGQQRRAGQPALTEVVRDRRVHRDDAVETELGHEVGDRVDVVVGRGRGRSSRAAGRARPGACAVGCGSDRHEDRAQLLDGLQVAQAGRVRRGDVDHEVVRERARAAARSSRSPAGASSTGVTLLLPMFTPTTHAAPGRRGAQPTQPRRDRRGALVVEAHPVAHGPLVEHPPQTRARRCPAARAR